LARTALIIRGSGQIGHASACALLADGWQVRCAQRHGGDLDPELIRMGAEAIENDRRQPGALALAVRGGVDALIDTIAFDEADARQLIALQADVGAFVVISSASVYCDARGRMLDEAAQNGFPDLPIPIAEDHATVTAGPQTYSTRKVALEQALLQEAKRPVTILRPSAIHGPASRHPREWWFVKRILDGRTSAPLAYKGESRFHTSATVNLAELIRIVLEAPATQILNAADPEALSVTAIGETIAAIYGCDLRLVAFDGPPVGPVGENPWAVPRPLIVDMSRAQALGYRPLARYQDAVASACRSAEAAARAGVAFPPYLTAMFDYAAEDAFLSARGL
jgi:nucleoside-diphosphate-sugar epimerase